MTVKIDNPESLLLPEQADPDSADRRSVAPYNFIPLPQEVLPAGRLADGRSPWEHHDEYLPGTHTGWIDLQITTETPLYVRCAPPAEHSGNEEPRTNPHRQDFFHRGSPETPVIPGSSLRGMTRSLIEILTHAAMPDGWFSDRQLIYRAVGDPTSLGIGYREQTLGSNLANAPNMHFQYPNRSLKGGYLRSHGSDWFIQPSLEFHNESLVHVEYDDARPVIGGEGRQRVHPVWIAPTLRTTSHRGPRGPGTLTLECAVSPAIQTRRGNSPPTPNLVEGWLVESGHMQHQKHMHCVIYAPDEAAAPVQISHELRRLYENDREISRGIATRPLFPASGGDVVPVFYLMDGNELTFFGPTMMFRLPYPHSIAKFIPEHLRQTGFVDFAQAMFGTVDGGLAIKGRIFFGDACWDGKGDRPFWDDDQGRRTPRILGSPKPTAFQHYLVQPEVDVHSGHHSFKGAAGEDKRTLNHYHHPAQVGGYNLADGSGNSIASTSGTVIRGYKRYWHKKDIHEDAIFQRTLSRATDKQLTIIRPVRPQTTFTSRIRFENLTDVELGALCAVLELKPTQRHHLGMGKSLGMGSVRIEPTLHLTDRVARYSRLIDDGGNCDEGELAKTDVDRAHTLCLHAINAVVIHHHNGGGPAETIASSDMWGIPRLADLAKMLEWDASPAHVKSNYVPPNETDLRWWRERRVLPTPFGVCPQSASNPPPNQHPSSSGQPRSQTSNETAPPPSNPGPAVVQSSSATPANQSTKRPSRTPVTVKFLGPRPNGRGFDVQEPGRRVGTLTLGPVPSPLPAEGTDVDVLIKDDATNCPQYQWKSVLTEPNAAKPKKPKKN